MIRTICPSTEKIADYLQGKTSAEDSDDIEQHLIECGPCEQTAIGLDASGDSLMRHLRLKPEACEEDRDWHACREMLSQLPSRIEQASPPSDAISLQKALRPASVYHYRLGQQIGHGGMGVVYQSHHPQLHRPVAVKILSASRAADAPSIARFQREMRAAGGLDHVGIVRAVDAGVWQGTYYLVMEYVDGIDLSRLVRECGPLAAADAVAMIVQAAEALQYAHNHQVIHRDIKPSNLMLTRAGAVKILDFGLARLEHGGLTNHDATTAGRLVGTLDYLAPEQAAGQQPIDSRADLYGLGATLFKLLSGRPPHGASVDRPILQHLQRLTTTEPDRLDQWRQDLDPLLCNAVARLLSRDPEQRPATAGEVVQLLRPFAAGADLAVLAQQAMVNIDRSRQEASEQPGSPGVLTTAPAEQKTSDAPPAVPANAETQQQVAPIRTRNGPGWGIAVCLMLLGLLGGYAAVTVWIHSGEATLKVESEVDDISLQLMEDGKIAKEIEVYTGEQETKIRAGKYELKIAGKTDHVRIDQRSLLVMRGNQRIVRISRDEVLPEAKIAADDHAPSQPPAGELTRQFIELEFKLQRLQATLGANHPTVMQAKRELSMLGSRMEKEPRTPADAPTSRGRTYEQWTQIVLRETDAATVAEGIAALVELSGETNHDRTFATLLAIAEQNEARVATPICDAYIRYLTSGGKDSGVWGELYPQAPAAWTTVVAALDKAMTAMRANISDQDFEQILESGSEASRRIMLAATINGQSNSATKAELCQRLRDPGQPAMVRAIAHYAFLDRLDSVPDEATRLALERESDAVVKAVAGTLFRLGKFPFPDQQGAAAGKLIAQGERGIVLYVSALIDQAAREGVKFRGRDSCLLLESVGSSIVKHWEDAADEIAALGAIEVVSRLSAVDLMMAATRRAAIGKLRFYLQRQLKERDALSPPLQNIDLVNSIYVTAEALAFLDGKIPDELETHRIKPNTEIGKRFEQWSKQVVAQPDAALDEAGLFLMQYPLEVSELLLKVIGNADESAAAQGAFSSRTRRPRYPVARMLPLWLGIPLAARDPSNAQNQVAIGRMLREIVDAEEFGYAFYVPRAYAEKLFQLAEANTAGEYRSFALRLAQLGGFDDDAKVQQLALKMLADAEKPRGEKNRVRLDPDELRFCLQCLADAESLELPQQRAIELSGHVINTDYRGMFTQPDDTMSKCFIAMLTINRRLGIDSKRDGGLLMATLGERQPTRQLNWPRSNPPRGGDSTNMAWARLTGAVPQTVLKHALETIIALPADDAAVLERLQELRKRADQFGIAQLDAEPIKLLDKAIAATQQKMKK